ncbi:MAG TPA: hypothetical protein VFZ91_06265 [Allosphingosinicella sp.]
MLLSKALLTAGATFALGCSTAASAQAWIGQVAAMSAQQANMRRCLKGHTAPDSEIEEARRAAAPLIEAYWARASAADPADVAGAFQAVGTAKWVEAGTERRRPEMKALRDPFALDPALALADAPSTFARAGAEPMNGARGVWAVRAKADGAVAGYYLVDFERFMMKWGIARIELIGADAPAPAVAPYCDKPGDVEAFAAARAEKAARKAARRAARGG